MNIPKPPEVEDEVSKLFLYGYSTEKISKTCKVSTGYVSGVASKLKERLGNKEVSAIRDLCRIFKKLGISAAEAFEGARIISILEEFGANIDDFRALLREVLQKCQKENIDPAKLAYQCRSITQIQAKTNVPLEDLPDECGRLLDAKNELEKKISLLEEEAGKANAETAKALSEKNQTKKSLEEFEQTKKELDSFELGFNNLSKLINILKQATDEGFSTDKIIRHLEKEESYEQRIAELEQQVKQLAAKETIQTRNVKELSKKIDTKKLVVTCLRRLEKLGLKVEDLETLYQTVIGIAKEHNIDEKTALQKLEDDLKNNYGKKHGLHSHLEKLQNEIAVKSIQLESIQVKIESFNIKNKENNHALNIIKTLKQNRIDPFLIITWNKILETSNLKPKMFEEKLQKFTNVNQLITAEQHELDQLTKEKKELESVLEFLESNKEKLETTINYGNELIKKSLAENIQEAVNQIKRTTEIGNNSIRITKDNVIESINKISQKTSKQIDEYVNKTKDLVNSATEASEKVGRAESFIPLYSLANGSLEPTTQFPVLVALLDKLYLEIQRKGNGSSSLLYDIKELREEFIKELSKIEQN